MPEDYQGRRGIIRGYLDQNQQPIHLFHRNIKPEEPFGISRHKRIGMIIGVRVVSFSVFFFPPGQRAAAQCQVEEQRAGYDNNMINRIPMVIDHKNCSAY